MVTETLGEKGMLEHCWWEGKLVRPLWEAVWRLLKILKIDIPYDPIIPILGNDAPKPKTTNSKRYLHP